MANLANNNWNDTHYLGGYSEAVDYNLCQGLAYPGIYGQVCTSGSTKYMTENASESEINDYSWWVIQMCIWLNPITDINLETKLRKY